MFTAAWNRKCKKKVKIFFTVRKPFMLLQGGLPNRKMKKWLKGTVCVNLSDSPCNDGKVFFSKVSFKPLTDRRSQRTLCDISQTCSNCRKT